jgi:hypothetical protein
MVKRQITNAAVSGEDGADHFRYTDEQWAAIECELPRGGRAEDYENFRRTIERYVHGYRQIAPKPQLTRNQLKRECRRVSNHATILMGSALSLYFLALRGMLLRDFYETGFLRDKDFTKDEDSTDFSEFLRILLRMKGLADKLHGRINTRGRGRYYFRDQLVYIMLIEWAHVGGQIRASGPRNGARDGGPLIRYLLAATRPVNLQPALTVDSARSIVRKNRERVLEAINLGINQRGPK